jgi:hypothetical protein
MKLKFIFKISVSKGEGVEVVEEVVAVRVFLIAPPVVSQKERHAHQPGPLLHAHAHRIEVSARNQLQGTNVHVGSMGRLLFLSKIPMRS